MSLPSRPQAIDSRPLDAAFRSLPGFAFIATLDGKLVHWNRGCEEVLGWTDDAMIALRLIDLVAPKDRDWVGALQDRTTDLQEATRELDVLTRDGRSVSISVATSLLDVDGCLHILGIGTEVAEHVAVETSAPESETTYREIFNATSEAIFLHDALGVVIDANERACVMYGCSREDIIRSSPERFSANSGDACAQEAYQRLERCHNGEPQVFRWHCRKLNGETFWAEVSLRATKIVGQRRVIATVRDITERLRSEAELHEKERRLALAVSATQDAIWEENVRTGESYYSRRWFEMLGYPEQDTRMDRERVRSLCHPDDYQQILRVVEAALRPGSSGKYEVTFRMRRADGRWAWILSRAAVMERDAAGNAAVIFGTNADITDRRQAEFEAVEWKHRYELLIQAAGEVVYDISRCGETIYGGAVEATLGYAPEEMLGGFSQWIGRLHPEDRERATAAAIAAGEAGEKFHAEYRYQHKSGEYVVISDTAYPYAIANGKVMRYIGVMVNVTAARRAEVERERLEERLRHAQKMESIGRLAGGVAHDFNNLLTTIGGNLSLAVLDEQINPDTRELLDEISKATQSAVHLTRQLLMFSRKQVIEPKVLCVNDTVQRIEKLLRRLIGEDIELRVVLSGELGSVRIDENQLEQIIVNLVINARDAMPHGGKLTIETENAELDEDYCRERGELGQGSYVRLSVSDTGTGMSPDVREHIFEPFFTTKEVGKGTGLGLAMVYGAVQQNHGVIEVYSEPGLGTRMHVYLSRTDLPIQVTRGAVVGETRGGAETIALVEDAESVRALAERILSRHGYRVLAYEDGEKALEAIKRLDHPIDLLLTDVVMPRMNGRELADRVLELMPRLRILFASGYSKDAILQEPGIEFIAKPYSVAELTRRVREILDKPN
ncbi:MAG TPA: PAS domain S-box protein [Polyangiaceae bacterium]|nr:PAS domain S-box protein [Polyangiaceae bacterium]